MSERIYPSIDALLRELLGIGPESERLGENLASLEFTLSDAQMAEIDRLKRPDSRVVSPPQAPKWDS